uniref:Carboxyl-ester lipase n=1 Tax=Fundulus heteroclitus TaxID=8078 RepID=A0A146SP10_FUNHE
MWKVSGRSSALERAQALLSARRSSRGDGGGGGGGGRGSTHDSPTKTQGGSFKTRSVPPNSHTLFSDLSDLSSDSSVSERAADAPSPANAREKPGKKAESTKDLRPQSSLGEGSRFLKKAPKPANSSHSPVRRDQAQPAVEPRYVSSSQRGSQAPALRRLAEIESRVRRRRQELEKAKQATAAAPSLTADLEISPAAAIQNMEASEELSAQSDSDQSRKENSFLKKTRAGAAERANTARPDATNSAEAGVKSTSRAADPVLHFGGLERTPRRIMSGVSLESDEEDIKKLLGDSIESISILGPGRVSAVKRPHRTLSSHNKRVESPASPAAAHPSSPSNSAPARSPLFSSHGSSPFRFTGQAKARFSPSVLSPSPSPPPAPPSHPDRLQRSHSSSSSHAEVLSLEELFPVEPASEDPRSHLSSVSSEDFKINVMTLDELIPAFPGTASEMPGKQNQNKMAGPAPGSNSRHQQSPREEEEEEEEEEEVVPDYQSDFDSDSSTRQVSEHLGDDDDDGAEGRSEVRQEVAGSERSHKNTDDYSSVFSEPTHSSVSRTLDGSQRSESFSRSRTSLTHSSQSSPQPPRRRASARRNLKDAAVQTQPGPLADPWSAGMPPLDPMVGRIYMKPTPAPPHTVGAERLEAISTFDPAVFALNEVLKQQLAMTKQFMDRSEYLHSCLLRSLEPPNYRYTTLEETLQNICKHRHPKPTVEKA